MSIVSSVTSQDVEARKFKAIRTLSQELQNPQKIFDIKRTYLIQRTSLLWSSRSGRNSGDMIGSERSLNNQSSSSSQSQTVTAGGATGNNGSCWSSSTVAPSMSGFNVYGNGSSSSTNTSLSASLMGPSLIMGTPLQQSAGVGGVNHQPMGGVNHHTMGGVNHQPMGRSQLLILTK